MVFLIDTLPDSPPDSGSEHLLSPQSSSNSTYSSSMTPNQLDVSSGNAGYIDSSPGTSVSTIAMSPPANCAKQPFTDNEINYSVPIQNQFVTNEKLRESIAFSNSAGHVITNNNGYSTQHISTPLANVNVYPDLNTVDYDLPMLLIEDQHQRKSSLPLAYNNDVSIKAVSYTHLTLPTNREV